MKLITLNVWGGRLHNEIMKFLEDNQDIDIFCFQEVYDNAHGKDTIWLNGTNLECLKDLQKALPNHQPYYHPHLGDWWGLAMFVKKSITVSDVDEIFVHKYKGHDIESEKLGHTAKNIQYVTVLNDNKKISILNIHGLWNGQGKNDSEDRISQSRKIVDFINGLKNDFVFCGDFNLLPETESIKMIEKELGVRNLIKDFGITSTRTSFYTKPDKYADYIFTSSGVQVKHFSVLPDELSDHSALFIEF